MLHVGLLMAVGLMVGTVLVILKVILWSVHIECEHRTHSEVTFTVSKAYAFNEECVDAFRARACATPRPGVLPDEIRVVVLGCDSQAVTSICMEYNNSHTWRPTVGVGRSLSGVV